MDATPTPPPGETPAAPAVVPEAVVTPPVETPAAPVETPSEEPATAVDFEAQLAEAQATIAALTTSADERAAADALAAQDVQKTMEERLTALGVKVETQRQAGLKRELTAAGVAPDLFEFALSKLPDVDPDTAVGLQAIQAFLTAHPSAVKTKPAGADAPVLDLKALTKDMPSGFLVAQALRQAGKETR